MLRIGKNPKDPEEKELSTAKPEMSTYTTPKTYSSYQPTPAETKPQIEYTSPTTPRAITESESIAREIKEGNLSGFVGGGTEVTGEATFKALMRVDGHLSGRISSSSGTLIVGANGRVDANIEVAIATVHGTVNGDIIATQRLELGRAAKLTGNIQTPSLVIEQGAIFEGACKMMQMSDAAEKNKKKTRYDQPLDTSSVKTVPAEGEVESTKIASVSSISSVAS